MNPYLKKVLDLINNGSMDNTYKMSWIRSIVESCEKSSKKNIHFIFPSSSQIFLNKKKNKYNEKDEFFRNNSYCKFRIEISKYLKKVNKKNNLKYINLILFNHDSVFRNKKSLLPRIVLAIKKKNEKFINMIYHENIIQDFSHAEDICFAIYLLIKKKVQNFPPDSLPTYLSSSYTQTYFGFKKCSREIFK